MLQGDSRRSVAGALCVGALPQVVAAADIVGRRLTGLPAVAALAGVAPGSSARSLASVL